MVDSWPTVPFAHLLAEPIRNGIYKSKLFHGRGAKIVNMGELFANPRLGPVPMKRVELSEAEAQRFLLAEGDLLFARRSLVAEGAGKCSIVLEIDEPTTFESSIIRARPDPSKADSLFLYYFFSSVYGRHSLATIRRQVAVAGITGTDLARLQIPVPRLDEQRAVAQVLGKLDSKIELNRRITGALQALAKGVFESWFVRCDPVLAKSQGREHGVSSVLARIFPDRFTDSELGAIPAGWHVGTLGELARRVIDKASTGPDWRADPLIDLGRMPPESIALDEWGVGGELTTSVTRFRKRDILFGAIRPYFHKVGIAPVDGVTNVSVFVIRPKNEPDGPFVSMLCSTSDAVDYATRVAKGTKMPVVGWRDFESYTLPMPPAEARAEFGRIAGPLLDRINCNIRQSRTLADTRDTLLPKLISGQLRAHKADRLLERAPQ